MESRFLDRLPLKPSGAGQQTLHPLVVASYNNEGVYSQAQYHTNLVITYHPVVGLDQPGQVLFGFSRDAMAPGPSGIAAMSPMAATPCWRPATITIDKSLLMTQRWLRMKDPCGYLVYWWSTPTPPGYFTFTCTIKALNPYRTQLPPTPEPVEWPVTPIRGQAGPCLYKFGFAECYKGAGGGLGLLSAGQMALSVGGKEASTNLISEPLATDMNSPYAPNFHLLFPGYRVLMIVFAHDFIIYQSSSGALTDVKSYAERNGRFVGINVRWVSKADTYKWYPKQPLGNLETNDWLIGWSIFDYTAARVWSDWVDPCPTAVMVAYYAVPPGMEIHASSISGIPCLTYNTNTSMTSDPLEIPITCIPQFGVFSDLAVGGGR